MQNQRTYIRVNLGAMVSPNILKAISEDILSDVNCRTAEDWGDSSGIEITIYSPEYRDELMAEAIEEDDEFDFIPVGYLYVGDSFAWGAYIYCDGSNIYHLNELRQLDEDAIY